jgi:streptogramin lyase
VIAAAPLEWRGSTPAREVLDDGHEAERGRAVRHRDRYGEDRRRAAPKRSNARSLITTFATVDTNDNLWFVNSLDGRLGRIDHATGRVDLLTGPGGNYNGITIFGTTLVLDGFTSTSPFVFTTNT